MNKTLRKPWHPMWIAAPKPKGSNCDCRRFHHSPPATELPPLNVGSNENLPPVGWTLPGFSNGNDGSNNWEPPEDRLSGGGGDTGNGNGGGSESNNRNGGSNANGGGSENSDNRNGGGGGSGGYFPKIPPLRKKKFPPIYLPEDCPTGYEKDPQYPTRCRPIERPSSPNQEEKLTRPPYRAIPLFPYQPKEERKRPSSSNGSDNIYTSPGQDNPPQNRPIHVAKPVDAFVNRPNRDRSSTSISSPGQDNPSQNRPIHVAKPVDAFVNRPNRDRSSTSNNGSEGGLPDIRLRWSMGRGFCSRVAGPRTAR